MSNKMTTNSQLPTTEPKQKQNQIKQTETGPESQKWRSHGGLTVRGEWGERYRE